MTQNLMKYYISLFWRNQLFFIKMRKLNKMII